MAHSILHCTLLACVTKLHGFERKVVNMGLCGWKHFTAIAMFASFRKSNLLQKPKEEKKVDIPKCVRSVKRDVRQRKKIQQRRKINETVEQKQNTRRYFYKSHNPKLYKKQQRIIDRRKILKDWFDLLDSDGSGEIDIHELASPLISLGFCRNYAEVVRIIDAVDDDGSGTLGADEFISIVEGGGGHTSSTSRNSGKRAVLTLLHALKSGEIGGTPDMLNLDLLISNYKRKRMMEGLLAYGQSEEELGAKTKLAHRQALSSLATLSHGVDQITKKSSSLYLPGDINPNEEKLERHKKHVETNNSQHKRTRRKANVSYKVPMVKSLMTMKTAEDKGHFVPDKRF